LVILLGDRGQVHIIGQAWGDNPPSHVWFYTHWGCHELIDTVRRGMIKAKGGERETTWGVIPESSRWDDDEYFARAIFQEMVGDHDGLTGYGIFGGENGQHGDVYRTVTINVPEKTVRVYTDSSYTKDKLRFEGSFEDFVNTAEESIQWYDPDE